MVERIIEEQLKKSYEIFERFRRWNGTIRNLTPTQNTNTCCELMEDTASMQHDLFRILHFLVYNGGLNVCSGLRQSRSRARSCSPYRPRSESPVMRRTCSTIRCAPTVYQNTSPVNNQSCSIQNESFRTSQSNLDKELLDMLLESQNQCDRLAKKLREQLQKQTEFRTNASQLVGYQPNNVNGAQNIPLLYTQPSYSRSTTPVNCCMKNDMERCNTVSSMPTPVLVRPVSQPNSGGLSASDSRLYQPGAADDLHQWLSPLVARYNDIFTNARVQTMEKLQSVGTNDYERCQRIIFYTVQVCFALTRRQLRRTLPTANMSGTFMSTDLQRSNCPYPGNTYSNKSLDSQQLTQLVLATARRLTRRPPPDCACRVTSAAGSFNYDMNEPVRGVPLTQIELNALEELIREVCLLAWHLLTEHQATASRSFAGCSAHQNGSPRIWHVDVDRSAKPADKYDPKCYRRSYDSDFSATMVHHFVWPCLILFSRPVQPDSQYDMGYSTNTISTNLLASVLSKGEACTRNPLNSASQQDRAAALLNNECQAPICCPPIQYQPLQRPMNRKKTLCQKMGFRRS